jgi:hypothetical protein
MQFFHANMRKIIIASFIFLLMPSFTVTRLYCSDDSCRYWDESSMERIAEETYNFDMFAGYRFIENTILNLQFWKAFITTKFIFLIMSLVIFSYIAACGMVYLSKR